MWISMNEGSHETRTRAMHLKEKQVKLPRVITMWQVDPNQRFQLRIASLWNRISSNSWINVLIVSNSERLRCREILFSRLLSNRCLVSPRSRVISLASLTWHIAGKSAVSATNRIAMKLNHIEWLNSCSNRLTFRTFTLSREFTFKASCKPLSETHFK